MLADGGFLTCAIHLPRRNDLVSKDVDEALWGLANAGFAPDPKGQLRVAEERRIPEVSGETQRARVLDGAVNIDQALRQLRRVSPDYWGQVMLRGQYAVGGRFEAVTAVVCPFASRSPGMLSAHLMFRDPGVLTVDRPPAERVAHALEALGRMADAMTPVLIALDTRQFEPNADELRRGRIPWLPWAGYLAPGAVRNIGGGGLARLNEWVPWLEVALDATGAGGARMTTGGGLLWVLPETGLGRPAPGEVGGPLEAWRAYLQKVLRG